MRGRYALSTGLYVGGQDAAGREARGERTSIPEGEAGGRPVSDSPKEEGGDGGCINAAYAYVIFEEGC